MKITTHSRSTLSLTSTLLYLFALMTPGLCQAADGGAPASAVIIRRDSDGNTLLAYAVCYKTATHVHEILNDLTVLDAELNAASPKGLTAVHEAAMDGNREKLRALLTNPRITKETICALVPSSHATALHFAASTGLLSTIEELFSCDRFTVTNTLCKDGDSALHYIANIWAFSPPRKDYNKAYLLMTAKTAKGEHRLAEVDAPNQEGLTPLHVAIKNSLLDTRHYRALDRGKPNILSALVGRRITINVDKDGPIAEAIRTHGLDSDECQALLVDQSQPDARDSQKSLVSITRHPKRERTDSSDEDEAAAETEAEDTITHESQLRRTVDPNVGTTKRIPMY